jgi:hypothetical protein
MTEVDLSDRIRQLLTPLESLQSPNELLALSLAFLIDTSNVDYQNDLATLASKYR